MTRERMYLESMESVFAKSKKVIVDVKKGNSLIYLPLDKIGRGDGHRGVPTQQGVGEPSPSTAPSTTKGDRQREVR